MPKGKNAVIDMLSRRFQCYASVVRKEVYKVVYKVGSRSIRFLEEVYKVFGLGL